MKEEVDPLSSEESNICGINLKRHQSLYNEMIKNLRSSNFTSRTSKSNTEILFNSKINASKENGINIDLCDSKKKSVYERLLISYDSKIKSIFDIIVLIMVNISSIIILYDFCFVETDKDYNNLFTNKPLYYVIEALFIIFIILQFFQEYQDPVTLLIIKDFKQIALKYVRSWFIIDLLSIIPFELFIKSSDTDLKYLKIIRFLRLPKFIQTIDVKRFDNLATSFLTKDEKNNASQRLMAIFNVRYFFKIIRLMIMASILSYVLGCIWYLICLFVFKKRFNIGYPKTKTFYTEYKLYNKSPIKKLMLCCYFVLTGLTTVGYGDYYPSNEYEKMFGIIIMFLGVAIFSYVMSEFSDQINIYNQTFVEKEQGSDLDNYIASLNEFCPKSSFNKGLVKNINDHFKFFWKNDRMFSIDKNNKYLSNLPKDLKIELVKYFWYDIFSKYNNFLLYKKYGNIYYKYYYDLSFLLMPRLFSKNEIIYKQNEEVEELYLIVDGIASLGPGHHQSVIQYRHHFYSGEHLGVYYCLFNIHSEFECIAVEECKLYALNKIEFLKLLKDYPEIEKQIRGIQYNIYKSIKKRMDENIMKEIKEINNYTFKYIPENLVDVEENKNGMTINNVLSKEIRKKEITINKLEEILKQKYELGNNKLNDFKKNYDNFLNRLNPEKYGFNISHIK